MVQWKEYRIKDICEIIDGDRGKNYPQDSDFYDEGFCLFLNAGNVTKNGWNFNNVHFITKEKDTLLRKGKASVNDIIMTTRGTVGNFTLFDNQVPYLNIRINSGMVIIRTIETIDKYFLLYLFQSDYVQNIIKLFCSGSAQPQLPIKDFNKIKLRFPPLPTQQKIASILSAYDNLIQNYKKQIEALQTAASELYKEWFVRFRFPGYQTTRFENGIPEGWKIDKVKNCVNRLPFGQTYKKDELESEGKVIVIDQSEDEFLGYHNNEPSHKASAENPIALFGDHSCKYKLMIKDFSLGENIIPYISKGVDLYYLYYSVYKIVQTEEYKRHWNLFVNKKILIPNTELQKSFRQKVIQIFKQKEMLDKQITNLTQQRDLLLPRLMSGKLEVKK